jgi:hypothetical protein
MPGLVRLIPASLLAISAIAFAGAVYLTDYSSWAPLTLPMPGPGLKIDASFVVSTSDKFRFEAGVPISVPGDGLHLPELPPVACDLEAQILQKGQPLRTARIRSFEYGGRGTTELYSSDVVIELRRGTYELRLLNRGTSQPFGQSGALLWLTRFVRPAEAYLQGVLLRGIGWFALALGVLSIVIVEVRARLHNG